MQEKIKVMIKNYVPADNSLPHFYLYFQVILWLTLGSFQAKTSQIKNALLE